MTEWLCGAPEACCAQGRSRQGGRLAGSDHAGGDRGLGPEPPPAEGEVRKQGAPPHLAGHRRGVTEREASSEVMPRSQDVGMEKGGRQEMGSGNSFLIHYFVF